MDQSSITFQTRTNQGMLHLQVTLDDQVHWQGPVTMDSVAVKIEWDNEVEMDHVLAITMSGKLTQDTRIDEQGQIQEDKFLELSDIAIDDILLGHVFVEKAEYHHDFNGTQNAVEDEFYGIMGCNGTVRLKFSSPVYTWLLENL